MILHWVLAALHLLALGIGLGAVWARGQNLRSALTPEDLRRVFRADNLWGLAAVLWISTGLWRLLAGVEKTTGYYLHNHVLDKDESAPAGHRARDRTNAHAHPVETALSGRPARRPCG